MEKLLSKKGDLNLLSTGVFVLVLGAVVLVFGLLFLNSLYEDTIDDTATVTNETFTAISNKTNESVTAAVRGECGFSDFAISACYNKTNGWLVPATNYTAYTNGYFIDTETTCYNVDGGDGTWACGYDWNCTYSYSTGNSSSCDRAADTIEGIGEFGGYFDLIVLAIIISVIISLLLVAFARKKAK